MFENIIIKFIITISRVGISHNEVKHVKSISTKGRFISHVADDNQASFSFNLRARLLYRNHHPSLLSALT